MHYLTILYFVLLITAYAVLSHFQLKKLKGKVVQIMEGKLENKQLSNLINKARTSSKNQFTIFLLFKGLVFSIIFIILLIAVDLLFQSHEFDITFYIIIFLFLIVVLSLSVIARANAIWNLCILNK